MSTKSWTQIKRTHWQVHVHSLVGWLVGYIKLAMVSFSTSTTEYTDSKRADETLFYIASKLSIGPVTSIPVQICEPHAFATLI